MTIQPATPTETAAAPAPGAGNGAAPAAAPAFAPPPQLAAFLQAEENRKAFEEWFPKAANAFTQPDFDRYKEAETARLRKIERERDGYKTAAALDDEAKGNVGNYEYARQKLIKSYALQGVDAELLADFPSIELIEKHGDAALKKGAKAAKTETPVDAAGLADLAQRLQALGITVPGEQRTDAAATSSAAQLGGPVTKDNIDALHLAGTLPGGDARYRKFLDTGQL